MGCAFHIDARPGILSHDQIHRIHLATLEVLENTGVRIEETESLELLRSAGADTSDPQRVRIPAFLVEEAIQRAPEEVVIYDRNGEPAMRLGGTRFYFGAHGDCPEILDPLTRLRRRFVAADAGVVARVCDALENIDFVSLNGFADDCPDPRYAAPLVFAEMVRNTAKPLGFGCADEEILEEVLDIAAIAAGGRDELRAKPFLYHYSEPTSPMVHSNASLRRLITSVRNGIPIVYTPMPMAGATAPCSFAGTLTVGSADCLTGLVIAQCLRPGAPFIYGGIPGIMDMRTTIYAYGAPEMLLMVQAMTDMAHHYQLPMFGTAGCTDAKQVDQQAAIETALSCFAAVLSGANLVHDVGLVDHADMVSAEMMVLTDEVVAMVRRATQAIEVETNTLVTDLIDSVGPGGHFLAEEHTFEHFREFWTPSLLDRTRHQPETAEDLPSFAERLNRKTREIMTGHQPAALAPERESRIAARVAEWRT